MWWAGKRTAATVYLGQQQLRLWDSDAQAERLIADGRSLPECLDALQKDLQPKGRVSLTVLVGGAWCQPFLLPMVDGVRNESEWCSIAASMVSDLTGMPPESRLWLDGVYGTHRLVVALHPQVAEALDELGERHRIKQIRPWWAEVLNVLKRSDPPADLDDALAVADSDSVTLMLAHGDAFEVAQTYWLMDEDPSTILARALVSKGRSIDEVRLERITREGLQGDTATAGNVPFLEMKA